jgi:catechol 2,3-dioxygenase-like lactoylglutathione lyase family enzyme
MKIHHIAITVNNLKESENFYKEAFGIGAASKLRF